MFLEAITYYNRLLEKDPNNVRALNNNGAALWLSGSPTEGVALLQVRREWGDGERERDGGGCSSLAGEKRGIEEGENSVVYSAVGVL